MPNSSRSSPCEWGLDVVTLDYAAVGFGSHHWRAVSAFGDRFVTVDDLVARRHDRLLAALRTAPCIA